MVKISGELDLGDFKNFIKATDQYNKTPQSKLALDNRHAKLDKIIQEFAEKELKLDAQEIKQEVVANSIQNNTETMQAIKIVD